MVLRVSAWSSSHEDTYSQCREPVFTLNCAYLTRPGSVLGADVPGECANRHTLQRTLTDFRCMCACGIILKLITPCIQRYKHPIRYAWLRFTWQWCASYSLPARRPHFPVVDCLPPLDDAVMGVLQNETTPSVSEYVITTWMRWVVTTPCLQ